MWSLGPLVRKVQALEEQNIFSLMQEVVLYTVFAHRMGWIFPQCSSSPGQSPQTWNGLTLLVLLLWSSDLGEYRNQARLPSRVESMSPKKSYRMIEESRGMKEGVGYKRNWKWWNSCRERRKYSAAREEQIRTKERLLPREAWKEAVWIKNSLLWRWKAT